MLELRAVEEFVIPPWCLLVKLLIQLSALKNINVSSI